MGTASGASWSFRVYEEKIIVNYNGRGLTDLKIHTLALVWYNKVRINRTLDLTSLFTRKVKNYHFIAISLKPRKPCPPILVYMHYTSTHYLHEFFELKLKSLSSLYTYVEHFLGRTYPSSPGRIAMFA